MGGPLKSFFVVLFGIAAFLVLSGSDELALAGVGTVVAAPLAAVTLAWVASALSGNPRAIQVVGVVVIILISTTVRYREYEDKSVDFQILMKLSSIALMFFFAGAGILFSRLMPLLLAARWWLALLIYFVFTSSYSETMIFSAITSLSILSCCCFCLYLVHSVGTHRAIEVVIVSSTLICLASIFVFFAFPQLGKMQGWTAGEYGSLDRMRGVTPSANAIGSVAALGLLFAYLYGRRMQGLMRYVTVVAVPSALICLVLSNNRMAMAGTVLAAVCASVLRGHTLLKGGLLTTLGLLGLCVFLSFPDQILTALSRSGDAAELTSATGRSYIWAVVIEHIVAQPVVGYGYTASMSMLPKDPRLFSAAMHAHNLYLEVLFSGGLIALTLFATALFVTLKGALRARASREAAILVFFLAKGMVEATPFSGIIAFNAFAFFVAIAIVTAENAGVPAAAGAARVRTRSGWYNTAGVRRATP